MSNNVSKKIKEFIASYWNEPLENLSDETRIEDDLGITGDDAYDFMENYRNKFEVDLTGFQFDKHFGTEASFDTRVLILLALISFVFGFLGWQSGLTLIAIIFVFVIWYFQKKGKKGVGENVLKIKHLTKATLEKRWNYDYNKV